MIVYNTTPAPIVITTKFVKDPLGGPGIREIDFMIGPGQGIDLNVVGLGPKENIPEVFNDSSCPDKLP